MAQDSDVDSIEYIDAQLDESIFGEPVDSGPHLEQTLVTDSLVHDKAPEMKESRNMTSILRPRAYQLEMLEKSLESNIIVAFVWFLAPTVALCGQQYSQISSQLPTARLLFLSGADNVDRWSEQRIWDAVLKDIQVVVSTHQVLLDALTHGFVHMTDISLLVFDEAHHCVRKHPANRIMQDFYHPILRDVLRSGHQSHDRLPHILGLTASPVINSKPGSLNLIEKNLNALSKTPKIHRDEFLSYVHPPELQKLEFPELDGQEATPLLRGLLATLDLDIQKDPYVVELSARQDVKSRQILAEIMMSRRTYCQQHLKSLCIKAMNIYRELGPWAVDYYVAASVARLRGHAEANNEQLFDLKRPEQTYLLSVLDPIVHHATSTNLLSDEAIKISPKLRVLLDLLVSEHKPAFSGLVFVQQRSTVAVLSHLISIHPRTKDKFRCGTFVGTSSYAGRKAGIAELLDPRNQTSALDELRNGNKNLIITTSILEEGIDVSACNIVICFDEPPNLKSFVQRRGRARQTQSKYVIMIAENDHVAKGRNWDVLETEMKEAYMDDMRRLYEDMERDDLDENVDDLSFSIPKTGYVLTALQYCVAMRDFLFQQSSTLERC